MATFDTNLVRDAATSYFSKQAGPLDAIGSYAQQGADFVGNGASNLWKDVQSWRGWKQLRDKATGAWNQVQPALENAGDAALDFAKANPELAGAGLGALAGGVGLTGLGSMSSAITGVPQRAPLMQRALTNAALGALAGGSLGFAHRTFNQPSPSGTLGAR